VTTSLPDGGLRLNPDVTRPPFRWLVDVPGDPSWSVLDTNPATWLRGAERLVDARLSGQLLGAVQRRRTVNFIADLVAQCQRSDTLLSMIQLDWDSSGQLVAAGLHLAWYDSTPDLASLSTVRQAVSRQGIIAEHDTPAGAVLLQRDHVSLAPFPGHDPVGLASIQAFLPLPGQCWTAVVATATPHPSMTEPLHDLALSVAGSIRLADQSGAVNDATGRGARGRAHVVKPRHIPGIARGFGPLRPHRVDPDSLRTAPEPSPDAESPDAASPDDVDT
jgi:hypothetical protein